MKKTITTIICILLAGVITFGIVSIIKNKETNQTTTNTSQEVETIKQISELNNQIKTLQEKIDEYNQEIVELNNQIEELEESDINNQSIIEDLQNTINEKTTIIEDLQQQVENLQESQEIPEGYWLVTYYYKNPTINISQYQTFKIELVKNNDSVLPQAGPNFDGYTFNGWYYTNESGAKTSFTLNVVVTKNLNVYAEYTKGTTIPGPNTGIS